MRMQMRMRIRIRIREATSSVRGQCTAWWRGGMVAWWHGGMGWEAAPLASGSFEFTSHATDSWQPWTGAACSRTLRPVARGAWCCSDPKCSETAVLTGSFSHREPFMVMTIGPSRPWPKCEREAFTNQVHAWGPKDRLGLREETLVFGTGLLPSTFFGFSGFSTLSSSLR